MLFCQNKNIIQTIHFSFFAFLINLAYDSFVFGQTFNVKIPIGATTSNIDKPFIQKTINVPNNSSIIWANNDDTPHTITYSNQTLSTSLFDSRLYSSKVKHLE